MRDRSTWTIGDYVEELSYLLEIQKIPGVIEKIAELQIEVFYKFDIADLESAGMGVVEVRVEYLH